MKKLIIAIILGFNINFLCAESLNVSSYEDAKSQLLEMIILNYLILESMESFVNGFALSPCLLKEEFDAINEIKQNIIDIRSGIDSKTNVTYHSYELWKRNKDEVYRRFGLKPSFLFQK